MRAIIVKDGISLNTIQIETDCVCITQAEADAMDPDELALGKFYIIEQGAQIVPVVDEPTE